MDINIDDTLLQQVDTTKLLGLLIDSNLSWNSHSQHVFKIVSKYNIERCVSLFLCIPWKLSIILSFFLVIWCYDLGSFQQFQPRFCVSSTKVCHSLLYKVPLACTLDSDPLFHLFLPSRFTTSINFNRPLFLCINFTIKYFRLISLVTISLMLILHLTTMIQGMHTTPSLQQLNSPCQQYLQIPGPTTMVSTTNSPKRFSIASFKNAFKTALISS